MHTRIGAEQIFVDFRPSFRNQFGALCGVQGQFIRGNGFIQDDSVPEAEICRQPRLDGGSAGFNQVIISKAGFEDWMSKEIHVEMDSPGCNPINVPLDVYLKPLPNPINTLDQDIN